MIHKMNSDIGCVKFTRVELGDLESSGLFWVLIDGFVACDFELFFLHKWISYNIFTCRAYTHAYRTYTAYTFIFIYEKILCYEKTQIKPNCTVCRPWSLPDGRGFPGWEGRPCTTRFVLGILSSFLIMVLQKSFFHDLGFYTYSSVGTYIQYMYMNRLCTERKV